eukprot:TRINITY_DN14839_c0_g1_i2.p1 TRINITY_DN14839_c0_g1~~TRINITY_DN14839_c0_g1_i2.p1  ORF type:complete len:289 (+),score=28.92 TRINITY_DN14839_c0_g1_i2:99-965(+)
MNKQHLTAKSSFLRENKENDQEVVQIWVNPFSHPTGIMNQSRLGNLNEDPLLSSNKSMDRSGILNSSLHLKSTNRSRIENSLSIDECEESSEASSFDDIDQDENEPHINTRLNELYVDNLTSLFDTYNSDILELEERLLSGPIKKEAHENGLKLCSNEEIMDIVNSVSLKGHLASKKMIISMVDQKELEEGSYIIPHQLQEEKTEEDTIINQINTTLTLFLSKNETSRKIIQSIDQAVQKSVVIVQNYDKKDALNTSIFGIQTRCYLCLLYTSPSPRDRQKSRMPSSA